jgi:hypothetical protein
MLSGRAPPLRLGTGTTGPSKVSIRQAAALYSASMIAFSVGHGRMAAPTFFLSGW